jgi:hypothetical protein
MNRHTSQPPQDVGSAIAAYVILFVAIGVMVLPTLASLWLGLAPVVNALL